MAINPINEGMSVNEGKEAKTGPYARFDAIVDAVSVLGFILAVGFLFYGLMATIQLIKGSRLQ